MEAKELKITIPENQEIDWQESAKQERIVFKKKENTEPRSWEEYCCQQQEANKKGYFIKDTNCDICEISWGGRNVEAYKWKNILPSKELTEAFRAMMQLMSLRHDWIHKWLIDIGITDEWEPNWDGTTSHYCVIILDNKYTVDKFYRYRQPLSFPTKEMADDFMNCFKDLLEIAKPII